MKLRTSGEDIRIFEHFICIFRPAVPYIQAKAVEGEQRNFCISMRVRVRVGVSARVRISCVFCLRLHVCARMCASA